MGKEAAPPLGFPKDEIFQLPYNNTIKKKKKRRRRKRKLSKNVKLKPC